MSECPHGLFDVCCTNYDNCSLNAPKRKWQGLTDEDIWELVQKTPRFDETVAAVEAKLKQKNA